jgi:hypothetical protein
VDLQLVDDRDEVAGLDRHPPRRADLGDVPATSASTGISIFIDSGAPGCRPGRSVSLADHDLEHTGHDLGANILGHFTLTLALLHRTPVPLYRTTTPGGQAVVGAVRDWGNSSTTEVHHGQAWPQEEDRKHSKANHGKRPNAGSKAG